MIWLSVAATAPPDVADYSIAAIDYLPGPGDTVGKLQAGLLCLPKGKLRWRDIARISDSTAIGRLSVALRARGLSVAEPPDPLFADAQPVTRFRIRLVVESALLKQCVAGSSLVRQRPSGSGAILVRWETYDRQTRALVETQRFDVAVAIDGRDMRNSTAVLSDALDESAGRYAAHRLN